MSCLCLHVIDLFLSKLFISGRFNIYGDVTSTELLCISCSVCPNINILHYSSNAFVKTKKLTFVHSINYKASRLYLDFFSFLTNVFFFVPESQAGHHVAFSRHVSLVSPAL